jgi:hypothetical protein
MKLTLANRRRVGSYGKMQNIIDAEFTVIEGRKTLVPLDRSVRRPNWLLIAYDEIMDCLCGQWEDSPPSAAPQTPRDVAVAPRRGPALFVRPSLNRP